MTLHWVTWVTIWSVVALLIIGAGQYLRFRLHERAAAREFARQLAERDGLLGQLQQLDDEAFWAAMQPREPKGHRREQR